MPYITLREYQAQTVKRMHKGCIVNGTVGSGKSRTSLAYYAHLYGANLYYFKQNTETLEWDDGPFDYETGKRVTSMRYSFMVNPPDLYIITPAKKRDSLDWDEEMLPFMLSTHPEYSKYSNKVVVDSWNNIRKYVNVRNAFFIFDEQKVSGYGAWVKTFLELAKHNDWILLSATPGDKWNDYLPVFLANGFFKNKTEFNREHVVFNTWNKSYPQIDHYVNSGKLRKLRDSILIHMDFKRTTVQHHIHVVYDYDKQLYDQIKTKRWDIYKNAPIENATTYARCLEHVAGTSPDHKIKLLEVLEEHPKAIIFYNWDWELEELKMLFKDYPYAEWNGHRHQECPTGDKWLYIVQFGASEAWNCITTDTIIYYSQNYSYKVMEQAGGRIDRANTKFIDLYYYHFRNESPHDNAIRTALRTKQKFNEDAVYGKLFKNKRVEK